ncbi:MAG: SPOR domain-containing protein [Pseudomonadota bacterium]
MSDTLKNRLVGTIILVAVVVIFLPQWLDGEKQSSEQSFLKVPGKPEPLIIPAVEPVDIDKLKAAANPADSIENVLPEVKQFEQNLTLQNNDEIQTDDALSSDASDDLLQTDVTQQNEPVIPPDLIDTPSENPVMDTPVVIPSNETKPAQGSWVIQLGVFGKQANVQRVMRQASNAGFRVFEQAVNAETGKLTRVLVGPELDKKILESALSELQKVTGLQGEITEFQVSAE